jgi:hypothetical protein
MGWLVGWVGKVYLRDNGEECNGYRSEHCQGCEVRFAGGDDGFGEEEAAEQEEEGEEDEEDEVEDEHCCRDDALAVELGWEIRTTATLVIGLGGDAYLVWQLVY